MARITRAGSAGLLLHEGDASGRTLRAAALVAFLHRVGADAAQSLLARPHLWAADAFLGGLAVVLIASWAAVLLTRNEMPEQEFRRIVERGEGFAKLPPAEQPLSEFDEHSRLALPSMTYRRNSTRF